MSRRPSTRTARLATWIAIPAALLVSGAAVAGGSYSAFSATTSNPTSNWTTGSVVLTDDDGGTTSASALFNTANASNLKPGSTGSNCIAVTSTGTLASAVKLYASGAATGTLAPYVTVKIEQGTGGGFGTCTGFSAGSTLYNGLASTFGTTYTSYSNGLATWSPSGTGSESKVFKVTYTIDSGLTNTFQNSTAGLGFTWEAQNS